MSSMRPGPLKRAGRARVLAATGAALLTVPMVASAQTHDISTSPGLVAPSFRDTTGSTSNTTFFGWNPGTFDGPVDNELIDGPAAQGATAGDLPDPSGLGGTLFQVGTNDLLSGSNNVYTGGFTNQAFNLGVPTDGTPGAGGATTIIVQGRTIFGGYSTASDSFVFSDVAGVSPTYVQGINTAGQGQFWAKYQLPGNAASYPITFTAVDGATSIAELKVDTLFSPAGSFAPDLAVVPEPASAAFLLVGGALLAARRRRGA